MQLKCKFGTNVPLSLFEDNDEPLSFVGYSFSRSFILMEILLILVMSMRVISME